MKTKNKNIETACLYIPSLDKKVTGQNSKEGKAAIREKRDVEGSRYRIKKVKEDIGKPINILSNCALELISSERDRARVIYRKETDSFLK